MNSVRLLVFPVISLFLISPVYSDLIPNDSYIAGYATGILKRDFELDLSSLVVRNGTITLSVPQLAPKDRAQIMKMLSEIPGVNSVKLQEIGSQQADVAVALPVTENGVPAGPFVVDSTVLPTGFLPTGHLFKPLLADPRWAHFSAAYRNYVGGNLDGNNNGSVSFGETIPFYRANLGQSTIQWEAGLQAGVFSDFNLDARSSDLINTDFIASAYSSMRKGPLSAFARIYHQSSHLGDEFLLRTRLERINLSYEGADLRFSQDLPYGVRIYGGGGGIFHKNPSTIKPWSVQYGIEFRSPWRINFASMRPVMAVDFKNYEQNNWSLDVSARAGVQFDQFGAFNRRLQFLIEYYNGNSPTGQFNKEAVQYLGIGAHFHF